MTSVPRILEYLKAASEPTRLRLLALCAERDFSVSDLAGVLGQSEPRVSRHLKLLCDAGLLERARQGQWVHYRLSRSETAGTFVRGLLAQADRDDAALAGDRERARLATADRAAAIPAESRLGRALSAFVDANTHIGGASRSLLLGVEQLELLQSAAALATECLVVARSRRAAQIARGFAMRHGVRCRILSSSDPPPGPDEPQYDAMVVNRLAGGDTPLAATLGRARRRIASGGRMWLFERYDALESTREAGRTRAVEHPLARLRHVLAESGFECQRLVPIEADGVHVLAAVALPATFSAIARTGS